MSNSLSLKSLPAPVRSLIRPMLFAAIGLHALLLFAPLPSEEKPKKPDDKENPVKITQLPTAKPAARPKLAKPALPKINRPKPAVNAPPVPKVPATPRSSDAGKSTDTTTKDPFADFPHHPLAAPNCSVKPDLSENCRDVSASLGDVVAHFNKALPDKKFTIAPAGGDGIEAKLFTVSKGGKSLSLSILKESDTKTVYVLAPQPIKNLNALKGAVVTPAAIAGILDRVSPSNTTTTAQGGGGSSNDATSFDFQQSNDYYNSKGEQDEAIDSSPKIVDGKTAAEIYTDLKDYLQGKGYSTSDAGSYGGGPLYEIKDASYTGYLNLAPGNGGSTIVVIWKKKPG